jgi:RNA polymerase sigma-70 factor, ECF subfamily
VPEVEISPEVLSEYRRKLRYKVCYHLGSFCPDVDDVVQESLSRFLRALQDGKIRNPESAGAFLSGVCNHVVQEYRRRQWREPLLDPEQRRPEPSAAPEAESLELRQAISQAMTQLSDRDREILSRFYLEEKTKDEICAAMELSDGQFRVALFRAKDRFRKVFHQAVKRIPPEEH